MAKRKKLNTRLVLVLLVVGVAVLAIMGYGAYRLGWHRKVFRINPVEAARKAEIAQAEGNYGAAEKQLLRAVAGAPTPQDKADYYYKFAQMQLDRLEKQGAQMTDSQRAECRDKMFSALRNGIVQDETHVECQRMLTNLMWSYVQHGNPLAFIKEADALLALVPDDHEVTFRRALAWADLARAVPGANTENAIRDFRRAIELKSDEVLYHQAYAQFLLEAGRTDEALEAYKQAVSRIPDNGDLRVQYAAVLLGRGLESEAEEQIQEAIERDPNNPAGNLAMADRLLRDEEVNRALDALEKARQIDDSDYRVYRVLSIIYRTQGDSEKAYQTLRDGLAVIDAKLQEEATATAPAEAQTRQVLERNRHQLLGLLGNALLDEARQTEDAERRAKLLTEAREVLDRMTWPQAGPGEHHKLAGRLALQEGDIETAQSLLEQAYAALGPDRQVANALIQIYFIKDLPGKAGQVLDSLRRVPAFANDPRILFAKAQLEMRYGNVEEAKQLLEQVLRIAPNYTEARQWMQSIDVLQGDVPVDEMLAAEELPPMAISAVAARARRLWMTDQRDEAVRLMERLYAKVPDNEAVRRTLLSYYVGVEDIPKAKEILAEIKAAHPERTEQLELQERFIEEPDRQKRYALALQLADLNPDPLGRAMEKARYSLQYQDIEAYGKYLREAYEIKPDDPLVVEQLMGYAIEVKDWDLAEECIQAARDADLDQVGGKIFQARLEMARGQYAQALETLTQVVNERPESKFPWVMMGRCYSELGDSPKAERAFMEALRIDPAYVPALVAMAVMTERQGREQDHAGWVERAYRLAPSHPYIQEEYLQVLESRGDLDEAIAQRERLLRLDPDDLGNRTRLAVLYEKQGQIAQAEKLYKDIYADSPNKLAAAHLVAGFYLRTGRGTEGEKVLVDLLQNWPDKVAAYLVYADYLLNTNPAQARAAIDKAIELDPQDPRPHRALAALLAQRDDYAAAAAAMEAYLDLRSDDAEATRELLRYRIESRQLDKAAKQLEGLLAANPSDPALLTLKGNLASQRGQFDQALEAFSRALAIDRNHTEALLGQAAVYLFQGKTTEAKLVLTEAKGQSDDPRIAMVLANLHRRLGNPEMAAMVLREVLTNPATANYAPAMRELLRIYESQQRWPKVADLLAEAKSKFPQDPYYYLVEANVYRTTGQAARAVGAMEKAMELAPDSAGVLQQYLLSLVEAGDFNKALAVADSYKDKPNYGPVHMAIHARALALLNRPDEADALFLEAIKTAASADLTMITTQLQSAYGTDVAVGKMAQWVQARPEDSLFHLLLGEMYFKAGEMSKAVESYTRASALATTAVDKSIAERDLGMALYGLGRKAEAEKAYLAALEANPDDPVALNNLAYMYGSEMDQPEKALPYIARAAELVPNNPDVLDTHGWVLAKTGNYVAAERQLARALQLTEAPASEALVRYHLGWVCEQNGRVQEAARHYRQGLEVLPEPSGEVYEALTGGLERLRQEQPSNP